MPEECISGLEKGTAYLAVSWYWPNALLLVQALVAVPIIPVNFFPTPTHLALLAFIKTVVLATEAHGVVYIARRNLVVSRNL
jgi:hypothetical protein